MSIQAVNAVVFLRLALEVRSMVSLVAWWHGKVAAGVFGFRGLRCFVGDVGGYPPSSWLVPCIRSHPLGIA